MCNDWWDNDNRNWQMADTIYTTDTGEVWYTPDGEGRIYYDTPAEALEDTDAKNMRRITSEGII